ncbi:MAG: AAA family ATPase [Granulosicoccus sp.]
MDKTIIALTGLPASGKSAVAIRLHKALDSVLLDKDRVRESMFQRYVDYSREQNDLCLDLIYQAALYLLSRERSPVVIIDGRSYSRKSQVDTLKNVVAKARCRLCLVECICSAESARQRLLQDQGVHPAKDRDYAMYLRSKASAEPIEEPRLILDTDELSADECAEKALAYMAGTP